MGIDKNYHIESKDNWKRYANAKGLRCKVCGSAVEYCDRVKYFETKMCYPCSAASVFWVSDSRCSAARHRLSYFADEQNRR